MTIPAQADDKNITILTRALTCPNIYFYLFNFYMQRCDVKYKFENMYV